MVKYKTKSVFICPYCDEKYESYARAYDCAVKCSLIDLPEERSEPVCVCEYCGKSFTDEDEAQGCEETHEELEDMYYCRVRLKEAADHPSQRKVIIV